MSQNPKLWIDITDLWYWKGTFTGIQNVVDRYVQLYLERPDVHFFLFEPPHQLFREVSKTEWETQRKSILAYSEEESNAKPVKSLKLTARHYAVKTAKRLVPRPIKQRLRSRLDAYREAKRGQKAQRLHPFSAGDTVLIIGGSWGDDFIGFMEGLAKIRNKVNIRLLHVVHDIIPLRYPNYFAPSKSFERYFKAAAKVVDGYICVSKCTADDLRSYLASAPHRPDVSIDVFRLGEDFPAVAQPERPPLPIADTFIVCIGTIEARKNQALIYNAVKLAQERGIDLPQVIIVGRVGWMASETLRNLTVDPDLRGKVLVSHTITDEQKAWLLKHCLFTVYPSFYEGWGLPVVESLYNKKLCICSNASSLKEAGEDYAVYTSPYDADAFLRAMVNHLDPKELAKREKNISKRHSFTWQESFTHFSKVVDKLR